MTSVSSSSNRPWRRWLRQAGPWLIAGVILVVLVERVSWDDLRRVLADGAHGKLLLYTLLANAAFVTVDGWSTQRTLGLAGCHRPLRELILVRGALNLVGLLHVAAVQAMWVLYLYRSGESRQRALFLVGLIMMSQVVGLVILGAPGGWVARLPIELSVISLVGVVTLVVFIVAWPSIDRTLGKRFPRWVSPGRLDRRLMIGAIVFRLPHLIVLALGQWGALRLWNVAVPWFEGMVLTPIVLLVSALPIAPAGFGTTQAAMVWLFSPWADGVDLAAREVAVLAISLSWSSYGWLVQMLIGGICFAALPARWRNLGMVAAREPTSDAARTTNDV